MQIFVNRIGVPIDDLGHDLDVSTLAGATFTIGVCRRGVHVVIQQCTLLIDFVVFLMDKFEVIFSMDWMTRHRALIDYQKKKVQLQLSRQ